jgi:integrase/recombinase XerD
MKALIKQLRHDGIFPKTPLSEEDKKLIANRLNYHRELRLRHEQFEHTPLSDAIKEWLNTLSPSTSRNYAYYIQDLRRRGFIPEKDNNNMVYTLGHFNRHPHNYLIDKIKQVEDWAEGTRQLHAACYISLTAFLNRATDGWFGRAQPSVLAANPTFFQTHDKCVTKALTLTECTRFIDALDKINKRDGLIARCMLQGAKRVSEAIELTLEQIDWDKNIIRFYQKKTGGMIKEIPITYPQHYMDTLKEYIASTTEQRKEARYVFVTRTGRMLTRIRLNHSFARASEAAGIKKVSPHVLRATWVTLAKQQNLQDTEIMKITGHTSSKAIYSYDKTSSEENFTKKFLLV